MYKQGAPPDPVLLDQSADPVQLQQNICYAATSAGSYKQQGDQETDNDPHSVLIEYCQLKKQLFCFET